MMVSYLAVPVSLYGVAGHVGWRLVVSLNDGDGQLSGFLYHGHGSRIDHRSHDDAGLDVVPTAHLGPTASKIERKGRRSEKGEANRAAAQLTAQIEDAADDLDDLKLIQVRRAESDKRDADLRAIRAEHQAIPASKIVLDWTTPVLKAALDAYGVARAAFEKLLSWRTIAKKIEDWRLAHPTRARLRIMDSDLVGLERERDELGEVDHDAERKLRLAEAELLRVKGEAERNLEPAPRPTLSKKKRDELDKIWEQSREFSELRNEKQATRNKPSNGYSGPSF